MRVSTQPAPVRHQTVTNLRQAILEGHFQPGDRLYEQRLCDLMGVSRTSIREALRQLESEGLVTMLPNRGPVVTEVTLQDAEDIYQVRELLEGLAAELFARRADTRETEALEAAVEGLEQCVRQKDDRALLKKKNEFYEILFKGCRNLVLYSLLKSLLARVSVLRGISLSRPQRPRQSLAEIKKIINAIKAGDPEAACQASKEHVRRAAAAAIRSLSEQLEEDQISKEKGEDYAK
jgi:DNA-binding GntR family transcriptional regulator